MVNNPAMKLACVYSIKVWLTTAVLCAFILQVVYIFSIYVEDSLSYSLHMILGVTIYVVTASVLLSIPSWLVFTVICCIVYNRSYPMKKTKSILAYCSIVLTLPFYLSWLGAR